jgi:dTDP-4-amino-4,6-dideoxy-D-galactose acyltransferase
LVDVGIDSTFRFGKVPLPTSVASLTIRKARDEDVPALRELAADAFVLSRFATDPFFSDESVSAFYRQWVTNLYDGLAQAVLVCEVEGESVGFVSCAMTEDEGRIPLIATRASARGRGIGRGLVSEALRWFESAGASMAHVKTQSANYAALALYHRAGFTISRTELTFSTALSQQPVGANQDQAEVQ